jgi:hypothetical protein
MHQLVRQFVSGALSRRSFFDRLVVTGFTAAAAQAIVAAATDDQTSDGTPSSGSGPARSTFSPTQARMRSVSSTLSQVTPNCR